MMIFKKAIPRRTFLRGVGTALALPLLDGMVPALAQAAADTDTKSKVRLSIAYVPNGIYMKTWTPQGEGALGELSHTLKPLERFKDQMDATPEAVYATLAGQPGAATGGRSEAAD